GHRDEWPAAQTHLPFRARVPLFLVSGRFVDSAVQQPLTSETAPLPSDRTKLAPAWQEGRSHYERRFPVPSTAQKPARLGAQETCPGPSCELAGSFCHAHDLIDDLFRIFDRAVKFIL